MLHLVPNFLGTNSQKSCLPVAAELHVARVTAPLARFPLFSPGELFLDPLLGLLPNQVTAPKSGQTSTVLQQQSPHISAISGQQICETAGNSERELVKKWEELIDKKIQ